MKKLYLILTLTCVFQVFSIEKTKSSILSNLETASTDKKNPILSLLSDKTRAHREFALSLINTTATYIKETAAGDEGIITAAQTLKRIAGEALGAATVAYGMIFKPIDEGKKITNSGIVEQVKSAMDNLLPMKNTIDQTLEKIDRWHLTKSKKDAVQVAKAFGEYLKTTISKLVQNYRIQATAYEGVGLIPKTSKL